MNRRCCVRVLVVGPSEEWKPWSPGVAGGGGRLCALANEAPRALKCRAIVVARSRAEEHAPHHRHAESTARAVTGVPCRDVQCGRDQGSNIERRGRLQVSFGSIPTSNSLDKIGSSTNFVDTTQERVMCGIWCAVSTHRPIWPCAETLRLLERRGPDSSGRSQVTLERTATTGQPETTYVTFYSTVLSLRGHGTVGQPHRSSSGSTLCWNGEAWEIAGHSPLLDNDTEAVANLLDSKACTPCEPMSRSDAVHERARAMAKALAQIVGPYALVYHDSSNDILYFGRDFLGRRSLLIRKTPDGALLVSSVAGAVSGQDETAWSEVEADGLYYVDLRMSGTNCDSQYIVHKVPYYFASSGAKAPGSSVGRLGTTILARAHSKVGDPFSFIEQEYSADVYPPEHICARCVPLGAAAHIIPAKTCQQHSDAGGRTANLTSCNPLLGWPRLHSPCTARPRHLPHEPDHRSAQRSIRKSSCSQVALFRKYEPIRAMSRPHHWASLTCSADTCLPRA